MNSKHTAKQRAALHVFFRQLAEDLNTAGLDRKLVMAHFDVDAPWTEESVKEMLWRPLQEAIAGFESTEDNSTTSYDAVYQTFVRHMALTHGFTVPPWPSIFVQSQKGVRDEI